MIKKAANLLKPFDIAFQPFIQEIEAKEMAIQKCADTATMERIRSMILPMVLSAIDKINAGIQTSKMIFRESSYS